MIKEIVRVKRVRDGKLDVEIKRKEICSGCRAREFCYGAGSEIVMEKGNLNISVGDELEIGLKESRSLITSFAAFFLPALLFTLTVFFLRTEEEIISFAAGVIILFLYYLAFKFILKRGHHQFKAEVLRKI
ncbi:MAG: hypothetical protein GF375_02310 [Candidatus Omnitrophica bacterium]|nr:hypothetical protein [Candidatus Omnitrophota bacterium]MBD3268947.1 hypothetical protein [Candidatus Omnitrophota bacterium]